MNSRKVQMRDWSGAGRVLILSVSSRTAGAAAPSARALSYLSAFQVAVSSGVWSSVIMVAWPAVGKPEGALADKK